MDIANIQTTPARMAATSTACAPGGRLLGTVRAEVCVVGAGYAGLSAALHLAERGYDTVVIEAQTVGAGASGRNGGQVLPGFAAEPRRLVAELGERRARALWGLSLQGVAKVRALAGTTCDVAERVAIFAARPADRAALDESVRLRRDVFADRLVETVDRPEMASLVRTARQHGGAVDHRAFALDPAKYVAALARRALVAGAQICEDSPARHISREGRLWQVETQGGRVLAGHVVLAANVDIPGLAPDARRLAAPLRTFMFETAPLAPDTRPLDGVAAAFDTSPTLHYFRQSADGRLLFGGGGWPSKGKPPFAHSFLRRGLNGMFPDLRGGKIVRAWSGLVDVTSDGMPRFAVKDGIWRLLGFCGHGVALATIAGQVVADAIDGEDAGFALMAGVAQKAMWPTLPGRVLQQMLQRV